MQFHPPGTRIAGRYEVAGRPMIGGMGIVYVCLDLQEDRPVALKTFRPEYLPDRSARERFLREGTHWVDLGTHPNIVRCYQVLQPETAIEVYLVLELVGREPGHDNASLRSWLTPGIPLPAEQALLFALQVARGMRHAVETIPGFVHRDLKPENVLVGADGLVNTRVNRLRVTDFGLAAALERTLDQGSALRDQEVDTSVGVDRTQLTRGVAGTPLYMAPEQWRRETVSAATDIYALGCILYEMLAGQRAVTGDSLLALQQAHCSPNRRPLPAEVLAEVGDVVTHCVAVEPGERFASWGALEMALVGAYESVAGEPAPPPESAAVSSKEERVATGWSHNVIGTSYLGIGKPEVALRCFRRVQEVGNTEKEHRLEASGLLGLGIAHFRLGDTKRAIVYYQQALAMFRSTGNKHDEGAVLDNLGSAYLQVGDVKQAIIYHEQALAIYRELGDQRGEAYNVGNLGTDYARQGDPRQALKFYEQSLAIWRDIGDRQGEGNDLGNLGGAYFELGHVQRAIGYHKQALAVHREIGDRRGEGADLGNLGNAYLQLGDVRHAASCHEQALAISREIGDRHGEGVDLGNLANACFQLNETQRAIGYYEQATAIQREIGDLMGLATNSLNSALLHVQQGEPGRALPLAQRAADIWGRIGHAPNAQRARRLVAQLQGNVAVGGSENSVPSPTDILARFGPVIDASVTGAQGNRQARAAVEALFGQFERGDWRIVEPIQRIWAGERDEARLTAGIDPNSALIVREILRRLND